MTIEENTRRTAPGAPWPKGVSGNPRGRPRNGMVHDVRALARKHGPEAFQTLVTLMRGADQRVAVRAAEAILDRAYGRPREMPDGGAAAGFTIVLRQYVIEANGHPPGVASPMMARVAAPAEAIALGQAEPAGDEVRVLVTHFAEPTPADVER
ncbi:MAG: hypothetical protein L0027_06565 [Candidatus Rokubacteria bacterium]|nr:hypothetical protein [Candidatus Rokubacteria bacterium]